MNTEIYIWFFSLSILMLAFMVVDLFLGRETDRRIKELRLNVQAIASAMKNCAICTKANTDAINYITAAMELVVEEITKNKKQNIEEGSHFCVCSICVCSNSEVDGVQKNIKKTCEDCGGVLFFTGDSEE